MNDDIKSYITHSGKKRFGFTIYLGKDETTGNSIQIRKRGFKTQSSAVQKYESVERKIRSGEYNPLQNSRYRVKDFYKIWFANYSNTVKGSTSRLIIILFKSHILKALGNVYLDKLTVVICQKVVNRWSKEQGKELFTLNTVYLTKMLNYAVMIDIIPSNPMKKVIKPRITEHHKEFTNYYSKSELTQFLEACRETKRPKIYTAFRVLSYSGMRIGELLALKWSDIDFENNTININKTLTATRHNFKIGSPKTPNSYRTLSMDAKTMQVLKNWRFQQRRDLFKLGFNPFNQDQFVFSNSKNSFLNEVTVRGWNIAVCKKNHLRCITLHGFRHTHASLLFQAHTPMEDVKERLGHSSITTTMNVYTHVTKTQKTEAINNFANFMES